MMKSTSKSISVKIQVNQNNEINIQHNKEKITKLLIKKDNYCIEFITTVP